MAVLELSLIEFMLKALRLSLTWKARRIRAVELAVGASSSKNVEIAGGTADSAVIAEDTTEGVQITEVVGSGKSDPPAC